jgi:hypothetical protein
MHVPYLLYNGVSLPLNLQMKFPCNYSTNVLENVSLTAVHAAFNPVRDHVDYRFNITILYSL